MSLFNSLISGNGYANESNFTDLSNVADLLAGKFSGFVKSADQHINDSSDDDNSENLTSDDNENIDIPLEKGSKIGFHTSIRQGKHCSTPAKSGQTNSASNAIPKTHGLVRNASPCTSSTSADGASPPGATMTLGWDPRQCHQTAFLGCHAHQLTRSSTDAKQPHAFTTHAWQESRSSSSHGRRMG